MEPRFVAVHNALSAMGLSQTGTISEGSLAEGTQARIPVELEAGECYTFVALGTKTVRDLGLRLVDPDDEELATDLSHDRQTALQGCPETNGQYTLVVKMVEGHGGYSVARWARRGSGRFQSGRVAASANGPGSCAEPIPLTDDESVSGDTQSGTHTMHGSCASGEAPELVYTLTVERRSQVSVNVQSSFDGALYLLRECGATQTEIACNDDAGDTSSSRIDTTLEPGNYFVVVDGYGGNAGAFELSVSRTPLQPIARVCGDALALPFGQPVTGSTDSRADQFQSTCAGGARSPDQVYQIDVPNRSRIRIRQQSDHDGVLHLRRECADADTEIACNDDRSDPQHSVVAAILDPGRYFVYADGFQGHSGNYTLEAQITSAAGGSGAPGDTCQDRAIAPIDEPFPADTFGATDQFQGSCGGQDSPDLSYRIRVGARSRLRVTANHSEFGGVMYLQRTCGDAASEVACTPIPSSVPRANPGMLDTEVTRGEYVLVVDGENNQSFGEVQLEIELTDLAAVERACRTAPLLASGRSISGNTQGGHDDFHASCTGDSQTNDTLYRLRLRRRSTVRIDMSSEFDGALHLRSHCTDVSTEVACNDDHEDNRHSRIEATLDAGTYYVIADGFGNGSEGPYTIEAHISNP